MYNNEDQPGKPPAPSADTFAAMHKARRAAGNKLVVLGYYSKTFHPTQRRWAIFDKEAGSIVMPCSHWYRLITGRPTTVYTDNTVEVSILTNFKCPRPPRLQRALGDRTGQLYAVSAYRIPYGLAE
eukprot:1214305-Pleurochrysis_carterae.AAC.1